jgi:hypothetical protein
MNVVQCFKPQMTRFADWLFLWKGGLLSVIVVFLIKEPPLLS